LYFNTATNFYSLPGGSVYPINSRIYKHNEGNYGAVYENVNGEPVITFDPTIPGYIYEWPTEDAIYNFEFELIHNELKTQDTVTSSLGYIADVTNKGYNVLEAGFTSLIVYNTNQLSKQIELEYLTNIRRIGNAWKINKFRDFAKLVTNMDAYYPDAGTLTTLSNNGQFTVNGMSEILNAAYLDYDKPWGQQRKFIDKWLGLKLICDNSRNNLVNLYSTTVERRKFYR
jgi:hypothetical protein